MPDQRAGHRDSVEVFGAPLSYEVAGTGPALVLIHEGIADSRMYDDQFPVFAERHRLVRYDLHGFGRSGKPQEPFFHHEALRGLLDHLEITHTSLLGMSVGGNIAAEFTVAYPDMVSSLILISTGFADYPPSEAMTSLFAPVGEAFAAGDFARAIDLSVHLWVDGPDRTPDDVDAGVRERVRAMYTDVLRRTREPGPEASRVDPPVYTRLGEMAVPTLVAVGTGGLVDIQEQAELAARTIPGAHKVELPRLGHVPNMERPAEVNRLVLDFLAATAAE
ncbi:MAG TPA: alpha/beta fold hydrolase [Chloroflexota bacterium]